MTFRNRRRTIEPEIDPWIIGIGTQAISEDAAIRDAWIRASTSG